MVHATLNTALDQGINYIDTAPAYGNGYSETLIGEVMKTRRYDCVLASKVWYELDRQGAIDSVHASLKRLQTDHIDILQIHGRMYTPAEVDRILNGGAARCAASSCEAGKIGHIGITTEEPWTVLPFLAHEAIEVYQIAYNIIYQAAARHFLIEAAKVNAGVVTMRTMTSGIFQREMGFLAPEWQARARSLRGQPEVRAVGFAHPRRHRRLPAGPRRWSGTSRSSRAGSRRSTSPTMPRLTFEVYKAEDAG